MQKHTHREYLTWIAWLEQQWDIPNRTDYYLAQIAAEVCRGNAKKPRSVKLKDFLLMFTTGKKKRAPTLQQKMAMSKAKWFGWLGIKGK